MANSAFTPAVLTVSGSSSTSSGEKNYVTATDGNASGLWTSSTSPTVTISTSTSTIPDNITKASSLAIAWVSGTTGYARYRFTLDQADYGKKFKIQWDQVYGTAGHWTLQVWSNTASDYTGTSTQLTVQTSAVPGITGTFTTSVDMPGSTAPYIEIRIVASSTSATTIYLNSILMGPGTITQGAAVSNSVAYTPVLTFSGGTTISSQVSSSSYTRIGEQMLLQINEVFTTATATPTGVTISIPSNLTTGGVSGQRFYGSADCFNLLSDRAGSQVQAVQGGQTVDLVLRSGVTYSAVGASRAIRAEVLFNIAEWSGSGTVSLGAGAQVEYAYNSSTSTTANDTSSFAYGPQGAKIQAITAALNRTVRFQYPIQTDDILTLQVSGDQRTWLDLDSLRVIGGSGISPYVTQNGAFYGAGIYSADVNGTDVIVRFGTYEQPTSTYGAAGEAWRAGGSDQYWRVRKAKASSPVGFGKADSTSFGLIGPRKGQVALTFSASTPAATPVRAIGIYYQDQDGNHRLKFNINYTVASGARTSSSITLTNVTFKNVASYYQAVAGCSDAANGSAGSYAQANSGVIYTSHASATTTQYFISGDVELDSKPSWA